MTNYMITMNCLTDILSTNGHLDLDYDLVYFILSKYNLQLIYIYLSPNTDFKFLIPFSLCYIFGLAY